MQLVLLVVKDIVFEASDAQDAFKAYFDSADGEADCPWQLQYVKSCGSAWN